MALFFVAAGCAGVQKGAEGDGVASVVESKAVMLEPANVEERSKRKKIAVLPFMNMTKNSSASDVVTDAYITAFFSDGKYAVEEPGNIRHFLMQEQVSTVGEMDLDKLVLLGRRMNVDAVVFGHVDQFETGLVYGTPVVGIYARMVDVSTGKLVWADQRMGRGDDYILVFEFGMIRTPVALANRVVEEMVEAIVW
ncbi:MAG: CsgG/HfaB family protein [Deltaproteobacteria bacterium]|nr:CsgG/HfaB family protein [Deltaproteobacteria bacterium]